jgi:hypothetical protein
MAAKRASAKPRLDEITLLDPVDLVCVNIRGQSDDQKLPEWTGDSWANCIKTEVCPEVDIQSNTGRAVCSLPLGIDVIFGVASGSAKSNHEINIPVATMLTGADGTKFPVILTVWRCGPAPETNATDMLFEKQDSYDGVLLTLPQYWIVPDKDFVPRKHHTTLFKGQPWDRFFNRFGAVLSSEVYFCTKQNRVLKDPEVMLLVKFKDKASAKKCAHTFQNRYVNQFKSTFLPGCRAVNSDLFKQRCDGGGGFPVDGYVAGMPFEHPHSMLDYLFEVMKLFGSENNLTGQAIEVVSAIIRLHSIAMETLVDSEDWKVKLPQEGQGRPQVTINKQGNGTDIDPSQCIERLEQHWPESPVWKPPVVKAAPPPPPPGGGQQGTPMHNSQGQMMGNQMMGNQMGGNMMGNQMMGNNMMGNQMGGNMMWNNQMGMRPNGGLAKNHSLNNYIVDGISSIFRYPHGVIF